MISPKNDDSMNSTFGNRDAQDQQTAVLYLNTADADMRGIATGDQVRVFNGRAVLPCARGGRGDRSWRGLYAIDAGASAPDRRSTTC